ncbi:MAG: caspase family protein [Theionarchaea archaeon]|nr:caspase family protein [Theionarchaea archaeon]
MKEIFLVCLLLAAMLPAGMPSEPVVLLTNSIDRELNSDVIDVLEGNYDVTVVDASGFEPYRTSTYIIILGGNKAPEGVGDIVETVLSEQERNEIGTEKRMLTKLNLWHEGQVVVLFAGPDREQTQGACQEGGTCYSSLLKAIERVREEVMTPDQKGIAFLWPHPLLSSDEIAPYAPAKGEFTKVPHLVSYPLEETCWFFWIDDDPYAKYAHPVRFVFFGIESGDLTMYNEEWWPVLNKVSLWAEEEEYWNTAYWVYSAEIERPAPSVSFYRIGAPVNQEEESTGKALVVNGWKKGEHSKETMEEDEKSMAAAFRETGLSVEEARTVKDIEKVLNVWSKEMEPDSNLVMYITAHGNRGYVVIGGEKFTVPALAKLLGDFEDGVHIFVIVDACYAGAFLADEMKDEAEIIMTSTSSTKCAYEDFDPKNDRNPLDKGSEFTSGLSQNFYMLQEISVDSPKDVYGRISAVVEDVMLDTIELDAAAQNDFSDPQLWITEATEGPPEVYT